MTSPDLATESQRQAKRRKQATIAFGIAGVLLLLGGISSPVDFLFAALSLGYAAYLRQGGSIVLWGSLKPRRRSLAWVYYAAVTVVAIVIGFGGPAFFAVALLTGLYSVYLYRGGRWVLWLW